MTRTISLAALAAAAALAGAPTASANHQYGDHRAIVVETTDAYGRSDLQQTLDARERLLEAQVGSSSNSSVEWAEIGTGLAIGVLLGTGLLLMVGRRSPSSR